MPEAEQQSERNDDLTQKVRGWLTRVGYPFELRVGQQLRRAGFFSVQYGRYFRDPEAEKWREIDLVATAMSEPHFADGAGQSSPPIVGVRLVVECKHGDRPWVVLASKTDPPDNQFPSSFVNGRVPAALLRQAETPNISSGSQHGSGLQLRAFSFGRFRGHNVVQAANLNATSRQGEEQPGGNHSARDSNAGMNAAYAALRSVTSAAAAIARLSDERDQQRLTHGNPLTGVTLALPVIVCNARLFRLVLTEDGREQLDEVQEVAIAGPPVGDEGTSKIVHVVRFGEPLNQLAARCLADANAIAAILQQNWPEYSARALREIGLSNPARVT